MDAMATAAAATYNIQQCLPVHFWALMAVDGLELGERECVASFVRSCGRVLCFVSRREMMNSLSSSSPTPTP